MTNLDISNCYVGENQVEKIYLGTDIVYEGGEPEPVYSAMPLTFEIISGGTISWSTNASLYGSKTIYYSKNDGGWTSYASSTGGTQIQVVAGDVVKFKGDNKTYSSGNNIQSFSGSTCMFKLKGNIMSLVNSTGFDTATTLYSARTFYKLFMGCTALTDASNLIFPATTLSEYCYSNMFNNCTSLTTAPKLLATTLSPYCYYDMFHGCTSLTTAPELPATTLAHDCYNSMFTNCTSLTAAPELPATTLADYCYDGMFQDCSNITTAPDLPANTLAASCYRYMFFRCYALNQIKCLATDISATNCTQNWLSNVAQTGTFVKHPNMTSWESGASGIPTGWTVQDAAI